VTIQIHTLNDWFLAAKELLTHYPDQRLFGFTGPMGAGKTTFIKAICRELKTLDPTSSPSFSIVNEYRTAEGKKLYHFDFYRIQSESEASDMGLEEYLDSGNYCFMEWPEKVENLLPKSCLNINIVISEKTRSISFSTCP
jgi:tRNA threonylcarbamoyladenosine biosynthesis protein TsaE